FFPTRSSKVLLSSHLSECTPVSNQHCDSQSQLGSAIRLFPSQMNENLMFVPQNAIERSWQRYSDKLLANGMDIAAYHDCLMPVFENYVSFWSFSDYTKSLANTLSDNYLVFVDLLKNPDLSIQDLSGKLKRDTPLLGKFDSLI
ncbi:MAG TPA: hypothetical protein VGN64_00420, partial [Dyadobacter sp.]|nr:hypothetical protein [Dyadobacter sp.]